MLVTHTHSPLPTYRSLIFLYVPARLLISSRRKSSFRTLIFCEVALIFLKVFCRPSSQRTCVAPNFSKRPGVHYTAFSKERPDALLPSHYSLKILRYTTSSGGLNEGSGTLVTTVLFMAILSRSTLLTNTRVDPERWYMKTYFLRQIIVYYVNWTSSISIFRDHTQL